MSNGTQLNTLLQAEGGGKAPRNRPVPVKVNDPSPAAGNTATGLSVPDSEHLLRAGLALDDGETMKSKTDEVQE